MYLLSFIFARRLSRGPMTRRDFAIVKHPRARTHGTNIYTQSFGAYVKDAHVLCFSGVCVCVCVGIEAAPDPTAGVVSEFRPDRYQTRNILIIPPFGGENPLFADPFLFPPLRLLTLFSFYSERRNR